MPLCCSPADLAPSYASVLVVGHDLERAVENLQADSPICPCVTVWCGACKRLAVDVSDRHLFPCASAHLAHAIAVHRAVEETFRRDVDLRQ